MLSLTIYTDDDLDRAKAELARLERAWENHSGNNPDKYWASISLARSKVALIEAALATALTAKEQIECKLDAAFPTASNKEVVEFEGRKYQRIFRPADKCADICAGTSRGTTCLIRRHHSDR